MKKIFKIILFIYVSIVANSSHCMQIKYENALKHCTCFLLAKRAICILEGGGCLGSSTPVLNHKISLLEEISLYPGHLTKIILSGTLLIALKILQKKSNNYDYKVFISAINKLIASLMFIAITDEDRQIFFSNNFENECTIYCNKKALVLALIYSVYACMTTMTVLKSIKNDWQWLNDQYPPIELINEITDIQDPVENISNDDELFICEYCGDAKPKNKKTFKICIDKNHAIHKECLLKNLSVFLQRTNLMDTTCDKGFCGLANQKPKINFVFRNKNKYRAKMLYKYAPIFLINIVLLYACIIQWYSAIEKSYVEVRQDFI